MRQILVTAIKIIQSNQYEKEALSRILFAVGTVLFQDGGKDIGSQLNVLGEVLQLSDLEGKGPVLLEEITSLMQ